MKRFSLAAMLLFVLSLAGCSSDERCIVVLSTNDMHAKIQNFPRLASAVAACRDTAEVVLVDAGDRWTGNAYVDRVSMPGLPVIRLMNRLGYDAATLGNHEFDHGQAFLGRMIDTMDFEVVCANVVSDTCTFPQLPPYTILERGGVKIGVVGVVTNYEGPGYPAGHAASFVGLRFPDPQLEAIAAADELRPKVDVLLLVSHMGDDRDEELLGLENRYDAIIGGHTHVERDTTIGGTLLTQTGRNLANVGALTLRLRGGRLVGADYRIVPLAGYDEEPSYAAEVKGYYDDPELNRPVGQFGATFLKTGLANWMARAQARAVQADIGIYHIGGVRLDSIPAGGVGAARVYDLEPFGTRVAVMHMTPAQIERMIVTKYNEETREGHRVDLVATAPYRIVVDGEDRAAGVLFEPALRADRTYRVAVTDYVYKNYHGLEYTDGEVTPLKVADLLLGELGVGHPLLPDNGAHQSVMTAACR